ncbi:unnamed protein product [Sphagnum jensenii]|uniref:F-box domain-containing protein n=1 Tax=Sphagnum jensenii TaxID=128206 RepID=A0ABP0X3G1_9BRYO
MVPPRLNVGHSKYWLRARSGNRRTGAKIIVSVNSLYNIFKENRRTDGASMRAVSNTVVPNVPALRKSARLFEKRAALLRCTRGGPQYWLRTRSKGNKRSLLVSVKSLYPSAKPEKEAPKGVSGGSSQPQPRRKSARLLEKQSALLLSCRTARKASSARHRVSEFKRKRKHICWLYKGTPWMGGSYSKMLGELADDKRLRGCGRDSTFEIQDGSTMAVSPSSKHSNQLCRPALQRLTEWGEEDLLQSILEKLPPAILLQAARVCRSWARLCEPAFKEECYRKGWSLPRHPRGTPPAFPWRSLYYRHACRACGKVGEFFVRKTLNGNFQFLLCGGCIRLPDVRDRLVQYSIDLYGVTGKLLVPSINVSRSANT